jgi:hypothetical protein
MNFVFDPDPAETSTGSTQHPQDATRNIYRQGGNPSENGAERGDEHGNAGCRLLKFSELVRMSREESPSLYRAIKR